MSNSLLSNIRQNIIGIDAKIDTPLGQRPITYADWTASGRLYLPIEKFITENLGPYVANTHTESNLTGSTMTAAYRDAQKIIKRHVNANENDALICAGSGMTTVINKLQRIMGLKELNRISDKQLNSNSVCGVKDGSELNGQNNKPIVFITHMEHHSNQTTWNTCNVDVVVIKRAENGQPCIYDLETQLKKHASRLLKIGSFTACSNVTGIKTDYHKLSKVMHLHDGLCFVDFACSAPYVDIDMHPADPLEKLDAIFFSPHKFLGGPGSCGILLFDKSIYNAEFPDQPGGGTVTWTNPWGKQGFYNDIELREDGGTPGFLQTIKASLAIKLKEHIGTKLISKEEKLLTQILLNGLKDIPEIELLEPDAVDRLCIVSFYSRTIHFNLFVRLLNDKFGIQARGGCSCAGTYGHILLGVDKKQSHSITTKIEQGDLSQKPGWVRVSLHPTSTVDEAYFIVAAVKSITKNWKNWREEYKFNASIAEFESLLVKQRTVNLDEFQPVNIEDNEQVA